jgi:hypothetical protein
MHRLRKPFTFAYKKIFVRDGGNALVSVAALLAEEFHHRLVARVDLQFVVNVLQMGADRVEADAHVIGDFLVKAALGELGENFGLASGQPLHFAGSATAAI